MDFKKIGILIGIFATSLYLLIEYTAFSDQQKAAVAAELQQSQLDTSGGIPSLIDGPTESSATTSSSNIISVKTDVLNIEIDLEGGDIIGSDLLNQKQAIDDPTPLRILNKTDSHTYIAQTGIVGPNATDSNIRPVFSADATEYSLEGDLLRVVLTLTNSDADIKKIYTFKRGQYVVDIDYEIANKMDSVWRGNLFAQIKRDDRKPPVANGVGMQPFLGMATTTADEHYFKQDFDDLAEKSFEYRNTGGWISMVQHYYISAFVANPEDSNRFFARKLGSSNNYLMGYTGPRVEVEAGTVGSMHTKFYVGPKDTTTLEGLAPYLDLTLDYGWLWWIAKPLFKVLEFFHGLAGNWGWAIIMLTIMVKIVFFYPNTIAAKSMAKMRKFAPLQQEIKERYADNKQKQQEEILKLFKKEKLNPMGGCLPILIQMPVFIALYYTLAESVELRHAEWLGWIVDLSAKDPFFILPLIFAGSMYVQQMIQMAPTDPMQAKIMKMMPIFMGVFFLFFPAGLVLYWVVNNLLTIAQTYYINKKMGVI